MHSYTPTGAASSRKVGLHKIVNANISEGLPLHLLHNHYASVEPKLLLKMPYHQPSLKIQGKRRKIRELVIYDHEDDDSNAPLWNGLFHDVGRLEWIDRWWEGGFTKGIPNTANNGLHHYIPDPELLISVLSMQYNGIEKDGLREDYIIRSRGDHYLVGVLHPRDDKRFYSVMRIRKVEEPRLKFEEIVKRFDGIADALKTSVVLQEYKDFRG